MKKQICIQLFTLCLLFSACKKNNNPDDAGKPPVSEFTHFTFTNTYLDHGMGLFPESIDFDNKRERIFISSFNLGEVFYYSIKETNFRSFATDPHFVTCTGVYVDEPRNRVIALGADIGSSEKSIRKGATGAGSVAYAGIFDINTGSLIKGVDLKGLTPGAGAFPNDLTVDATGNIFITDSFSPVIYRIDEKYQPSVFVKDALFETPSGSFGLNGIVFTKDGDLLVSKTDNGKLYHVPVRNAGKITEVNGFNLPGADGLEFDKDNKLIAVVNGLGNAGLHQFTSGNNWQSVAEVSVNKIANDAFPTSVAVASSGQTYILSSTSLGVFASGKKKPGDGFDVPSVIQSLNTLSKK